MDQKSHRHKWECLRDTKVICHGCDTVSEITDLLESCAASAATASKVNVLSGQLLAGELRKEAHEKAYAWVRRINPEAIKPMTQQGTLL
jgi:hypothetical protein